MEEWKCITGFEGLYQVSSLGRVRSMDRVVFHTTSGLTELKGKPLKAGRSGNGYYSVVLYKNYKRKTFNVHQLVANAFVTHPPGKNYVNHLDGDKSNNCANNLEYVSFRENVSHGVIMRQNKPVGISYNKGDNKWRAKICINGKKIDLGCHKSRYGAVNAYLDALKTYNIENKYAQKV